MTEQQKAKIPIPLILVGLVIVGVIGYSLLNKFTNNSGQNVAKNDDFKANNSLSTPVSSSTPILDNVMPQINQSNAANSTNTIATPEATLTPGIPDLKISNQEKPSATPIPTPTITQNKPVRNNPSDSSDNSSDDFDSPTFKPNGQLICPCSASGSISEGIAEYPGQDFLDQPYLFNDMDIKAGKLVSVKLNSRKGSWYFVKWESGRKGWVHGNNLKIW